MIISPVISSMLKLSVISPERMRNLMSAFGPESSSVAFIPSRMTYPTSVSSFRDISTPRGPKI